MTRESQIQKWNKPRSPRSSFRKFRAAAPSESARDFPKSDVRKLFLASLSRELTSVPTPRLVMAFRMRWRAGERPSLLTPHDRTLLPRLLDSPLLGDVRSEIAAIVERDDRGDFEQETLGPPEPRQWPC